MRVRGFTGLIVPQLCLAAWLATWDPGIARAQEILLEAPVSTIADFGSTIVFAAPCGGEFDPPNSTVGRQQRTSSSSRASYLYGPQCDDDAFASVNVAVSPAGAYWSTADGRIVRKRWLLEFDEPPTTISTTAAQPPASGIHLALDNEHVWWNESSSLYRASIDGGARESIYGFPLPIFDLRMSDDQHLFFRAGNGLFRLDWIEGQFGDLWTATFIGNAQSYSLANGRVYWADGPFGGGGPITVRSDLELGGAPRVEVPLPDAGIRILDALAADENGIYWLERANSIGTLVRRFFGSAENEVVSGVNPFAYHEFLVSNDHLFWADSFATRIYKTPTDSTPLSRPNLIAESLEGVQVIQDAANSTPLVEGKTTFVRFGARLAGGVTGRDAGRIWPIARLEGRANGLPLVGSPVEPFTGFANPVKTSPPNRRMRDEGILFRIPVAWTTVDALELTAVLDPRDVLTETNEGDNAASMTLSFLRKAPICAIVVPVETIAGKIGSYRSSHQPVLDRAQSLLPTEIWWFWRGGEALREPTFGFRPGQPSPTIVEVGPYELSSSDDDSGGLLARLVRRNLFGDDPDNCDDLGARTHHVALVPGSHPDPWANGTAVGDAHVSLFRRGFDRNASPASSGVGGITIAHEFGHNYDRDHVDCPTGSQDDIDSSYPYPVCQIDTLVATAHVGIDPLTRALLVPESTSDLMSAGHIVTPTAIPRWISDYTYEAILSELDSRPGGGGSASSRWAAEPTAADATAMLVVARPDPLRGRFFFEPGLPLSSSSSAKASAWLEDLPLANDFALVQRDAAEGILGAQTPRLLRAADGAAAGPVVIAHIVAAPGLARVVLEDVTRGGLEVGSLASGGARPSVEVTQPTPGSIVSGTLDVSWTADDPDGDTPFSSVRYSRDDGYTWQPLVIDSTTQHLSIPTQGLGACDGTCRIEVTVSDGLAGASAESGAFSVLADPLEVAIGFETDSDSWVPAHARIAQSDSVIARAIAYSDEAGPLTGDALQWNVDGPVSTSGAGSALELGRLPPGHYDVELVADDGQGGVASLMGGLDVEAKEIRESADFALDGACDDPGYRADRDPIRFADDGALAARPGEVRMVEDDAFVWICAAGLPNNQLSSAGERLTIRFDPDLSDGSVVSTSDAELVITDDAAMGWFEGDGAGGFVQETPDFALEAGVIDRGTSLSVEVRLAAPHGSDRPDRIGIQLEWLRPWVLGDVIDRWPPGSDPADPQTWGEVRLGPAPRLTWDLVPGQAPNHLDPTTGGFVTAGVFTTPGLDAPSEIPVEDLALGPGAAPVVLSTAIDLDGDQDLDLLVAFDKAAVDFAAAPDFLCLTGILGPTSTPFRVCDDFIPTCAPSDCDADGDGHADERDSCPWIPDSGLDSGGILTSVPDGRGDDCFCGDWDDSGIVDDADRARFRRWLVALPGNVVRPEKCDVSGDIDCNLIDLVVEARTLETHDRPPLLQTCAATRP